MIVGGGGLKEYLHDSIIKFETFVYINVDINIKKNNINYILVHIIQYFTKNTKQSKTVNINQFKIFLYLLSRDPEFDSEFERARLVLRRRLSVSEIILFTFNT